MKKISFKISLLVGVAACVAFSFAAIFSNTDGSRISAAARPSATPAKAVAATRALEFTDGEFDGKELIKTDAEWKKELSGPAYYILRQAGTERPYTSRLNGNKKAGTYYCDACGLALFSSKAKFESGTGWPSFYEPIFKKNVIEVSDKTLSEERIEVDCARCHSHLGHVFDDGPKPTGLRYCMNGDGLRFKAAQ
ncbi:MAG: peptide-methionine (R)-S-oxide reductase MsrB [Chloracidobacterium sp.]|nr:peptide-methionine (R)-S-oxide reductase MsrB [Chloracidobacterium sp.]